LPRYKGAASIKGTKLIVTTSGPPSETEAGARQESQEIKRQLRSIGVPYTRTEVFPIGEDGGND
jgi:hypothetical protein